MIILRLQASQEDEACEDLVNVWMQLRPNRRQHLSLVADGIADDQPNHETGEELSDDGRNDKGENDPREA